MHAPREGLYQSCSNNFEIQLFGFCHFFVFLNMGPYRRKSFNDISSESTNQIHSPEFMYTSREDLSYINVVERIVKY